MNGDTGAMVAECWAPRDADEVLDALGPGDSWPVRSARAVLRPDRTLAVGWTRRSRVLRDRARGTVVGLVGVYAADAHSLRCEGLVEIAPESRRCGYGGEALIVLRELAAAGGFERLRVSTPNGGGGQRFLRAHGFDQVGWVRQFSLSALRPRPSAFALPTRRTRTCGTFTAEYYADVREAPGAVLTAWQDAMSDADDGHRMSAEELRETVFLADEWNEEDQQPLLAVLRRDGGVAGALRLDEPFHNDELELEGGPCGSGSPAEAADVARVLLRTVQELLPYHSFCCELTEQQNGMAAALAEQQARLVWDVVRLEEAVHSMG